MHSHRYLLKLKAFWGQALPFLFHVYKEPSTTEPWSITGALWHFYKIQSIIMANHFLAPSWPLQMTAAACLVQEIIAVN